MHQPQACTNAFELEKWELDAIPIFQRLKLWVQFCNTWQNSWWQSEIRNIKIVFKIGIDSEIAREEHRRWIRHYCLLLAIKYLPHSWFRPYIDLEIFTYTVHQSQNISWNNVSKTVNYIQPFKFFSNFSPFLT